MDKRIKTAALIVIVIGLIYVYFQYVGPYNERLEERLYEHWFYAESDYDYTNFRDLVENFKVDKDLGVEVYLTGDFASLSGQNKIISIIDKFIENQSARGVSSITYYVNGSVFVPEI